MNIKKFFGMTTIAAAVFFGMSAAEACTSFELRAQDGTVMMTRTMEFAMNLNSNIRTYPRSDTFTTTNADGSAGLSWVSKYGFLYLDGFGVNTVVEGMNESGLSFEALLFPGSDSAYQVAPKNAEGRAIPYENFGAWVLGNFNNVDDLKKALSTVYVTPINLPQFGNTVFPLHFSVHDASGKGIIIEYVNGKLNVYNDTVGVLTNAPDYVWQVTNLRNYVNLSPYTPNPIVIGNMTFESSGQGSGMRGLPGDISPPSRFVKIMAIKSAALPTQNATDTLNLAEHIINNVDIPLGYVRAKQKNGPDLNESTEWTVFEDLSHKMFYYHTYTNMSLRSIDLTKINFAPGAPMLKLPLDPDPQTIIDNTALLSQSVTN